MTGKECRTYAAHALKEMHKPFLPQLSHCVKFICRCNGFGVLKSGGFSQRCLGQSWKWWHSSPLECFSVLLLRGNPWPQFRRFCFFFQSQYLTLTSSSKWAPQENGWDCTVSSRAGRSPLSQPPLCLKNAGRLGGMNLNLSEWGHFFPPLFPNTAIQALIKLLSDRKKKKEL